MMQDIEAAVLALIATRPMRSYEVRNELTGRGFAAGKVRDAVANLWDSGRLNVGLDQKLRVPGESDREVS